MVSAQPGLIPRICGKHTQDRICASCIFKDHKYDLNYVHLMTACNLEETIAAKRALEIKHYHTDNQHFACQGFLDEVAACGQTISFC